MTAFSRLAAVLRRLSCPRVPPIFTIRHGRRNGEKVKKNKEEKTKGQK